MKTKIKNLFQWRELVLDLSIVVLLTFFVQHLFSKESLMLSVFTPLQIYLIFIGCCFILVLFMAEMYEKFIDYIAQDWVMGLLKIVFFLSVTSIYLVSFLFFSTFHIMPWKSLGVKELDLMILLIPTFPIIWGLVIGFPFKEISTIKYIFYLPGVMACIFIPFMGLVAGYYYHWGLALPVIIGLAFVLLLPYFIKRITSSKKEKKFFSKIIEMKEKNKSLTREDLAAIEEESRLKMGEKAEILINITSAWKNFVFPLLCGAAMILWQKITIEMMVQIYSNWQSPPNLSFIFWSLFLSGIIPLRILAELTPPYKWLNTIIGTLTLGYAILKLFLAYH